MARREPHARLAATERPQETKLQRGLASRLFGDAILGNLAPSQFLCVLAWLVFAPWSVWGVATATILTVPATIAVAWTYRIRSTRLLGGCFGVTLFDVELVPTSGVDSELFELPRNASVKVLFLDDVVVHRAPLALSRTRIYLGYSRAIGKRRRGEWIAQIRSASPGRETTTGWGEN